MSEAAHRDRGLVEQFRDLYKGERQMCGWSPRRQYNEELCEAHHVRWLSRGGNDALSNLVLVCPDHHRAIHRCNAPFDFEQWAFKFGGTFESLALRRHELSSE